MSSTTDAREVVTVRKQAVLDLLRPLPEEIDPEELMYRLYVLAKIAAGDAALEAGEILSDDEVERLSEGWLN